MKVNSVLPFAIGISLCLHLSLLFLESAELSRTEASNQQTSSSLLIVALAEAKDETREIPEPVSLDKVAKEDDGATGEKSDSSQASAEAAIITPIQPETYFLLSELEEPPRILQDIDPNPANISSYGQGGRVVLQLWIDEHGNVVDQELVETMLPTVFVENAMESFAQAKFIAGIKDGRPVKSTVKVVVNYDPMIS